MHSKLISAAALVALAKLATAQTHTDCNPMKSCTFSCPPHPIF